MLFFEVLEVEGTRGRISRGSSCSTPRWGRSEAGGGRKLVWRSTSVIL